MAKIVNEIKVIKMLLEYDMVKSEEIAEAICCTKRQVRKYIEDLKEIGVNVGSKTGNNGGYFLKYSKCPVCGKEICELKR